MIGRRKASLYVLFGLGTFTAGIAAVFFTWDRFLLMWIPIASALSFSELSIISKGLFRERAISIGILVASVVIVPMALETATRKLPDFVGQHPYAEVEALRAVDDQAENGDALAGTAPFLRRYLRHAYVRIPDAFGREVHDPQVYFEQLDRLLQEHRVRYLVVSRVELRDRPQSLLGGSRTGTPPWLVALWSNDDATLWKIVPHRGGGQ